MYGVDGGFLFFEIDANIVRFSRQPFEALRRQIPPAAFFYDVVDLHRIVGFEGRHD